MTTPEVSMDDYYARCAALAEDVSWQPWPQHPMPVEGEVLTPNGVSTKPEYPVQPLHALKVAQESRLARKCPGCPSGVFNDLGICNGCGNER